LYPDRPLIPTGTDHEATGTSGADRFVLTHQQGDDFFFQLYDFSTQEGDVIDLSNLVTIPEGSAAKFVKTGYDDSGHGIEIEIDLDGKGEFGRGAEVKAYAYTDGPSDLFFVHGGGVIKA
ncbi:MAG: type I secretion C-terminal target domain-containing protein, partial [Oxalobacteraceae bacterium]